ncbi:MAG TPA: PQQ-dependent sugar dehydrogenase [Ilumatobacteraceae bacterium]
MSAATVLPTGFTDTEWVSGLNRPYQMEFAPDGRLFVSQQGGKLRVIKNGVLLPTPFLTVPVDSTGDRGLIGIAFDPAFSSNHFVYVYYTAATPVSHNRVSRFTANGDVAVAGSEQVLIELADLGTSTLHNGGSIHFGIDGKLYISTGDNVQGAVAQSLTSLLGKVLRLNPDGSIPADNPFASTASGTFRAIWAVGMRNPFTFGIQPGTGRIFLDDVGAMTWEEIDEGSAGANYGWPTTEGPTTDPRFVSPLFAYNHGSTATTGCAIAGGTFYNPAIEEFPATYVGKYFFGDACGGWIHVLDPATKTADQFLSAGVGVIDVKVGLDGNLYYLSRLNATNNPGIVHKITFSGKPAIESDPVDTTVMPGEPATFTVAATGEAPLSYQWQRDGADIAGATSSSYTLQAPALADDGAQFRVMVSNAVGSVTSPAATLSVTTNAAPTGTISTPAAGHTYNAGDTISFSGSATDPEDGTLPASAFSWDVTFHHNTHTHPGPTIGAGATGDGTTGSFVVPDTGETSTDVFYRITLTVTDSGGRSTESFVDVLPNTTTLNVNATPTSPNDGLQILLDGQPHLTPYSEGSVVGMKRTLDVVSPQVLGTTTYNFASWSDGGAANHQIVTPATATAYTATFVAAADAVKPVVSVTAPAAGATLSATATLSASASDNVGVTQVKWYVDSVEVAHDAAGPTWSQSWSTTAASNGTHKIFAKARDAAGNWGTSPSVTVTVNNTPSTVDTTPPTVSLTSPAAASVVSGTVTLSATAADAVGVVIVKWFVDGVERASDNDGAPWTRSWNSLSVANGTHKIFAKARDAAGNWGSSKVVSITVTNP